MSNADGTVAVWGVERQEEVFSVWGFPISAHNVVWSPSGDRIAATGPDTIRTWDVTTGESLLAMRGSASELRWIDDNEIAVVGQDNISLVDPVSGRVSYTLETGLDLQPEAGRWKSYIVWSTDGQYAALADNHEISILSLIEMSPVASPPTTLTLVEPVASLSTLPAASKPITITTVDRLALLGQFGRDDLRDALWSPDGSTIALLGTHGVWLYDDPGLTQPPRLLEIANGTVSAMLFSPDSRYLVLAVQNETNRDFGVRFWDLQSNTVARVLEGHTAPVTAVDFSADGRLLATGSADLTVRLWDTATGEQVHVLWDHVDSVLSVDFSPDSRLLVSAGDSMMRVWDVETGDLLTRGNGDTEYQRDPRVVNAQFTPDGKTVFYFYLNLSQEFVYLRTWSLNSDTPWEFGISPFGASGFVGSRRLYEIAFNPDGTFMLPYTLFGSDRGPTYLDSSERLNLGCLIDSGAAAFSPDGATMAIGVTRNLACEPYIEHEPKTIWLWDLQSGQRRAVLRGMLVPVGRLVYSPDSSRLLSVDTDNTIRLWDVETGEMLRILTDYSQPVSDMTFDTAGALISLEMARDAVVMRRNGEPIQGVVSYPVVGPNPPITEVIPSRDFSVLVTGLDDFSALYSNGRRYTIWNANTGITIVSPPYEISFGDTVAVNPSGTRLASSKDGVVKLWDVDTQTERTVLWDNPTLGVRGLAFSPDGRSLAGVISRLGNVVKFWELTAGAQRSVVLPDSAATITAQTFSPDSRYLAAQTREPDVWILSLETNAAPIVLHPGVKTIRDITFSQDSALIALATDEAIQLWDRAAGTLVGSLPASSVSLAFNQDDTRLASGESDGTIRLWGIQ